MNKRVLVATSCILWAVASFNITRKGIPAIVNDHRPVVALIALLVFAGFFMMFRKVSRRYADRVYALEGERHPLYKFMSLKGYILIGVMMSMGIGFSLIPGMPNVFFACLYPGLGLGLLSGSVRFLIRVIKGR